MLRALKIAAEQNQSTQLQEKMEEVAERVASGTPLHQAIANTSRHVSGPLGCDDWHR